jgi:hypothetical protein
MPGDMVKLIKSIDPITRRRIAAIAPPPWLAAAVSSPGADQKAPFLSFPIALGGEGSALFCLSRNAGSWESSLRSRGSHEPGVIPSEMAFASGWGGRKYVSCCFNLAGPRNGLFETLHFLVSRRPMLNQAIA